MQYFGACFACTLVKLQNLMVPACPQPSRPKTKPSFCRSILLYDGTSFILIMQDLSVHLEQHAFARASLLDQDSLDERKLL